MEALLTRAGWRVPCRAPVRACMPSLLILGRGSLLPPGRPESPVTVEMYCGLLRAKLLKEPLPCMLLGFGMGC